MGDDSSSPPKRTTLIVRPVSPRRWCGKHPNRKPIRRHQPQPRHMHAIPFWPITWTRLPARRRGLCSLPHPRRHSRSFPGPYTIFLDYCMVHAGVITPIGPGSCVSGPTWRVARLGQSAYACTCCWLPGGRQLYKEGSKQPVDICSPSQARFITLQAPLKQKR